MKIYVEITPKTANVFTRGKKTDSFILPLDENVKKIKSAVLVANVSCTGVRIVDVFVREKPATAKEWVLDRFKRKTPKHWDMVKSAFPIGVKMNEKTHIFDGSMFVNKAGLRRFFIAALSVDASAEIAEVGMALTGGEHRIKRLETVEHLLFRYYAPRFTEPFWVIFPQSEGFRILFLNEGLPCASWYMSNNPEYREDEISRFLQSSVIAERRKRPPPAKGVELQEISQISNYYKELENQRAQEAMEAAGKIKIALKKAIVLNNGLDLEWMYDFLMANDVEVEKDEYCLGNFL